MSATLTASTDLVYIAHMNDRCFFRWFVIVLTLSMPAWVSGASAQSPAHTILDGVQSVSAAGVPGPLAVFGEQSCAVVVGQLDKSSKLPVVAAAQWGRGRVLAFGHGGMIESEALKRADSAKLVVNGVHWLRADSTKPIAVIANPAMAQCLTSAGLQVVQPDESWLNRLEDYSVVVCDAHRFKPDTNAALGRFIQDGGGLLTAGLGWGWLQLNPGKSIADHPGNRLLNACGIAWCDGTLEAGANRMFSVIEISPDFHAANALRHLEESRNTGVKLTNQAAATLISALRVIPVNHSIYQTAKRLTESNESPIVVSQASPLRAKDGAERVIIALQVDLEKRAAPSEVRAHPSAAGFPGVVPSDAARTSKSIEIDRAIPGWHGTGLYAAPGEMIRVRIEGESSGMKVRIGCHTDELWHHDRWNRVPDIAREFSIRNGFAECASAFGGLIYIDNTKPKVGLSSVMIEGVVEAPRFVLGVTTNEQWKVLRGNPAPWAELESNRVIVSVPSASIRTLDDPESLMTFWNVISDAHATLGGVQAPPDRPHRFVADIQISAGYMHSGYPIMTHLDAAAFMTSLDTLKAGSWGLLHELGHNHQVGDWTFEGTGEVTCNLFALHAIDTICTPASGDRGHDGVNTPPSLEKYLAGGSDFQQWKRDPFLALHMYVQLEREFGWDTYKRVFAEYRDLKRPERPKNDAERRDQWMVRFSRACGKNLGPFFVKWGVPVSDDALKSISELPVWFPADWPQAHR